MTSIAPHIEAFLRDHLSQQRGASGHTCDSYAYSFQALFEFAASKLKVAPSALRLDQLDATLIAAFLRHLEVDRGQLGADAQRPLGGHSIIPPLPATSRTGSA